MTNPTTLMEADTNTPPPRFQGWRRRRGGRWWIASQGETEAEAFRKLLDAAQADGCGHGDLIVLPVGEEP